MALQVPLTAPQGRVLLITGAPGTGKTTVIRRLAEELRGWRLGGFHTAEIRGPGGRLGFRIASFDGRARTMAHVDFAGPRVGRYGVDVAAIDALAEAALAADSSTDAYLVDEIGKMECLSTRFVSRLRELLAEGPSLVATVALTGGGFIAEVKRLAGSAPWEVTRENRDALPARIAAWLRAARGEGG